MSLKIKITIGFLISAAIIGLLFVFQYKNFVAIKHEISYLEEADTIRSKSLQLRRHEMNYFLAGPVGGSKESEEVMRYLDELAGILDGLPSSGGDLAGKMKKAIEEYRGAFRRILSFHTRILSELNDLKRQYPDVSRLFPLLEIAVYERPADCVNYLQQILGVPPETRIIKDLQGLSLEISHLRIAGETILMAAKEIDKGARVRIDRDIEMNWYAVFLFFPFFLAVGAGTLLIIGNNVVSRLKLLGRMVERAENEGFSPGLTPKNIRGDDEVGQLIRQFDHLKEELSKREAELSERQNELLQSKKLAAIGTLASGIAHELNNPLNNIYLSAQVMRREAGEKCHPFIHEVVEDIFGQTLRVKGIVSDLLEFAREKEPQFRPVELNELVGRAYDLVRKIVSAEGIGFHVASEEEKIWLSADPERLERVFLNLFSNAIDAMGSKGELSVRIWKESDWVQVEISDTGQGIRQEDLDKIFDPFFTSKGKGTGLGLAIVFATIKKHHGQITVQSEVGKGTTFFIKLPAGNLEK